MRKLAARLDRGMFDEVVRERPKRARTSGAGVALITLSVLVALLDLACAVLGVVFVATGFPGVEGFVGVVLLLVAYVFRPRLGRLSGKRGLRREHAPTLYTLVDRVADALGAPRPEVILLAPEFNAWTGTVGVSRRKVLSLGMSLWVVLSPRQRVALLGHELAHAVNGDPTRGLLVSPVVSTLRTLAVGTGADRSFRAAAEDRGQSAVQWLVSVVMWLISRVFGVVYLAVVALASRDQRRAEYLADAKAVDMAGTDAVVETLDLLLLADEITTQVGHHAVNLGPDRWRGLVEALTVNKAGQIRELRQHSTATLWDTHPPTGRRADAVESWPAREPSVVLSDDESTRIDAELARAYTETHKLILGTREYYGK